MAAVVRVKRRRDADPAESLLISCKKHRQEICDSPINGQEDSPVSSVFKFAATISDKEAQNVSHHIRDAIRKEKLEKEYKHHQLHMDVAARVRREQKAAAEHNRYRVIAQRRALNLEGLDLNFQEPPQINHELIAGPVAELPAEPVNSTRKRNCDEMKDIESQSDSNTVQDKIFCLYDLEAEDGNRKTKQAKVEPDTIMCNGFAMQKVVVPTSSTSTGDAESGEEYVYDLYYLNKRDFDFRMLENILAIEAYNIEFEDLRQREEEEYYLDDDDDSNDESNWRNDYPDEDPCFYENQDADYYAGDDGHDFEEAFGETQDPDVWDLAEKLQQGILMDAGEDEDDANDDDESNPYYDSVNHTPLTSYESYKKRVLKEMGEDT